MVMARRAFVEAQLGWPRGTIRAMGPPYCSEAITQMKIQDNRRKVILGAAEQLRESGAEWPVFVQIVEGEERTGWRVHANGKVESWAPCANGWSMEHGQAADPDLDLCEACQDDLEIGGD